MKPPLIGMRDFKVIIKIFTRFYQKWISIPKSLPDMFKSKPKAEYLELNFSEGQIVKNFGFGRILWLSVDH